MAAPLLSSLDSLDSLHRPLPQSALPRPARWYDAIPKLAFAFKLLQVVPVSVQQCVLEQLQLSMVWTDPTTVFSAEPQSIRRVEDDDTLFWRVVNHIRYGSEQQRRVAADCILKTLSHEGLRYTV